MPGRSLTVAHASAIALDFVQPIWFLEIGFSTPLRLTDGISTSWNGQTWTSAKFKVNGIRFDGSIDQSISIDLADPLDAYAVLCVTEKLTERSVRIWIADATALATADPWEAPAYKGDSYSGSDFAVQIKAVIAVNQELPSALWEALIPADLQMQFTQELAWGNGRLTINVAS